MVGLIVVVHPVGHLKRHAGTTYRPASGPHPRWRLFASVRDVVLVHLRIVMAFAETGR